MDNNNNNNSKRTVWLDVFQQFHIRLEDHSTVQ